MKTAISIAVAALAMFGLAGLFTGMIARDFIASTVDPNMLRAPPNLAMTFLGYLLLAGLMAWSYRHFIHTVSVPWLSGLKLGIFFAVTWLIPYSIVLFSVYRFPYSALAIDLPWAFVEQATGGLLIGLIQGKRQHA